ncbi:MAG: RDD family protein [Acidobacteriia bacterium]|nr:RDD family protein [Terriglobia bacterium]
MLTAPEPVGWEETAEAGLGPSIPGPEPPPSEPVRPWREELSERVEDFRRRRERLKGSFDHSLSLEFDFPHAPGDEPNAPLDSEPADPEESETEWDFELDHPSALEGPSSRLDSLTLDRPAEGPGILQETESETVEARPLPAPQPPVEIVLDSSLTSDESDREAVPMTLPLAPMGRRFLGGLIDALVLLVSAGLFALIYWRAGGRLTPNPLNLAVVGLIGVFISLAYFGMFTALTSTTPGLLWVGIEVRNLQGNPPTARQAFWRAFGYTVSTSALLLGFVWALVDSEGLTWHDRMSDTYLTSVEGMEASPQSTVDS